MKMQKTIVAVILMLVSGFAGLFLGAVLDTDGVLSGILISGIACIVYAIDNSNNNQ